jgi:hypothetical protein
MVLPDRNRTVVLPVPVVSKRRAHDDDGGRHGNANDHGMSRRSTKSSNDMPTPNHDHHHDGCQGQVHTVFVDSRATRHDTGGRCQNKKEPGECEPVPPAPPQSPTHHAQQPQDGQRRKQDTGPLVFQSPFIFKHERCRPDCQPQVLQDHSRLRKGIA